MTKVASNMNREILRLAIPNIISNVSVPLLSTVDTALMGRLSAIHIGAVGLGSMIFNFIYWNFGFLRMGTTGLTAQAFGGNKPDAMIQTLVRALLIGLAIALLLLLLQNPILQFASFLLNVSNEQFPLVAAYFSIRIWAAPASLGLYAVIGWFFGMQNAIVPLMLTVSINVLNIGLSFWFVYGLQWDIAGVAWGTTLAQYFGLLLGLIIIFWKHQGVLTHLSAKALLALAPIKEFVRINADIFLRTFLLTLAFAFFYSQSATEDAAVLAVNVILLQFVNWMSYGIDGFAFASESLVGKYVGAKQQTDTYKAIRLSFLWGMGLAILYSLGYWFFGNALLRIFTDQSEVLEASQPFLIWVILFPLLSTPCYIWDGVFIGLTASRTMRNSMLLAFLCFIGAYFAFATNFANHGLWITLLFFMVARGVIQTIYFWKYKIALK